MATTEIIPFEELTEKIDSLTAENKFKTCGEFLLHAINDWPTTNLKDPKDILYELKTEIKNQLTYENLSNYSKELKIDISENAWKIESVTSLLEMFNLDREITVDNEITLEQIIERLTIHFRIKK